MEKRYFSYQQIHATARSMAQRISAANYKPDVIVAIGSGGFIPARILRTFLGAPILAVGIAYYDVHDKPSQFPRKLQWIEEAERQLAGGGSMLVDEVDDSRVTLEYCLRELLGHRPREIAVMVLHNKLKEKRGALPPEVRLYFSGEDLKDKWICYPWDADDIDEHERTANRAAAG